jgi:hypothetical protein
MSEPDCKTAPEGATHYSEKKIPDSIKWTVAIGFIAIST